MGGTGVPPVDSSGAGPGRYSDPSLTLRARMGRAGRYTHSARRPDATDVI